MPPAVESPRSLAALIALLCVSLLLPVILFAIGLPPKAVVYRGQFAVMGREFYETKSDIDVLVFGSSLLRIAVDKTMLERALAAKLGRPARVLIAGPNWAGLDLPYFMLRDLLSQRRVHMAILAVPIAQQNTSMPHVQLYRFLRYGDYPDVFHDMPWRYRPALYAAMTLGAPRQAVNLLRGNLVTPDETVSDMSIQDRDNTGYYGAQFVRDTRTPPVLDAQSMILSDAAFQRDSGLSGYQMEWVRRMGELLQSKGVETVFLNLPSDLDKGSTVVRERLDWRKYFGPRSRIVGVPSATLFRGVPDEEFYHFYGDQHFNRNGREYFTGAILPALLALYDKF